MDYKAMWDNLTDEQQVRLLEIVEYQDGNIEDTQFDAIDMTFPNRLLFFYNDRTAITDLGRAVYAVYAVYDVRTADTPQATDELDALRTQLAAVTAERDAARAALREIISYAPESEPPQDYDKAYSHWLLAEIARAALRAADAGSEGG